MNEIWKDVLNFEGLYQVSNLGNVRSLGRIVSHGSHGVKRILKGKVLKRQYTSNGYYQVSLSKDGKVKGKMIHRLVSDSFIKPLPKGMNVDHVDGNKHNNRLSNLEIVTPSENEKRAYALGLAKATITEQLKGADNPRSFKVECSDYRTGKSIGVFGSIEEGCRETGCRSGLVSLVVQGKRNHTKGLSWKLSS